MEKRVILPKTYVENIEKPLIFLAGPIRDARDWQEPAINYITSNNKEVIIANPRWDASEYIWNLAISGKTGYFNRQRAWEMHYLDIAQHNGAVLFWLADALGLMTRLELGELMIEYKHDNSTKFCVGGEKKFSDIETIRYELSRYAPDKKIFETLEETCQEAIKLTNQKCS